MKQKTILSLNDAQKIKKMERNNFYLWIEREKIPLYFKVPEGKKTFIASRKFLDLLVRGASPNELWLHQSQGRSEHAEVALAIDWLRIPISEYKTLFASGACRLHYFFEGLQLTEDDLKSVCPQSVKKPPFSRGPFPFDGIYCLTETLTPPLPAQYISLDQVSIHLDTSHPSPNIPSIFELPTYKYASTKLEIALQVWSDTWKKNFAHLNDRAVNDRKTIKNKKIEAAIAAKKELEKLYSSNGFKGEKYKDLQNEISKIIQPDILTDNKEHWFNTPISRGILAMIDTSDYFWAELNVKQYQSGFERMDVIKYLMDKHALKAIDAEIACRIIQPDNISRGRKK